MRCLVFGILLTSLSVGCVGATQVVCDLPVDAPGATRLMLGTWNVYTHEGELDGTLTFMADEVQVLTGPSWYRGVWSLQGESAGRFGLQMTFNSVEMDGERQPWNDALEVELDVVFSGRNEAMALQADGRWTRWERLAGGTE
ncbi:MAG: hypothetical protein KGO50_02250 [Myxococcales bacterium]|nr:hypothetical protein [Myxococcales bacterium]